MSSTATAQRLLTTRRLSGALLDTVIAVATLGGTVAVLRHGGIGPSLSGSKEMDLVGVVLIACSTIPVIAWRRFPLGVFAVTTVASVLLAGLGYRIDLLPGPPMAPYLPPASPDPGTPRTRRT